MRRTVRPFVSIVIPVFNSEQYLKECLSSIYQQTFLDWECLIVDDGSVDKSKDICDYYSDLDARFRVIKQSNKGVSSARNRALDEVMGEWICFVDSDDWIEPEFLEMMVSRSDDADLVVSGQVRDYIDEVICLSPDHSGCFTIEAANAEEFVYLEERLLLYAPHEKLFKAAIIKEWNLQYPIEYSYGEDLVFNYYYLDKVKTIRYLDFAKYHYRMTPGSLSNSFRANQFEVDYAQWKVLQSFYDRHKLWCKSAEEYLYRRLWGIVYDGIFVVPKIGRPVNKYLKKVLSIPEIPEMGKHKNVFKCARWIKYAVIHRCSLAFSFLFSLKSS